MKSLLGALDEFLVNRKAPQRGIEGKETDEEGDGEGLAALDLLAHEGDAPAAEVVVGPSARGGCYLVGMSRLHLEVFLKVDWGTPDLLKVMRRRLRDSGAAFGASTLANSVSFCQVSARGLVTRAIGTEPHR